MATLYELHDELIALEDLEELDRQEEIEDFLKVWTSAEGNLHDKIDNYACLIQELEARAIMRQDEARRMSDSFGCVPPRLLHAD